MVFWEEQKYCRITYGQWVEEDLSKSLWLFYILCLWNRLVAQEQNNKQFKQLASNYTTITIAQQQQQQQQQTIAQQQQQQQQQQQ